MRNVKIVTLVMLCILTAGLCGIFAYGMSGYGFYSGGSDNGAYESTGSLQLVMEEEVPLSGIDHISAQYDMNSNDIYISEGEGDVLTVREYSELDLKGDDLSTVKAAGGKIEIRGKRRNGKNLRVRIGMFGIRSAYGYTEIVLPASYRGQLSLSTASGDIRTEMDIALEKEFAAQTISGDVEIPNITAENISLKCSSGDIQIQSLNAGGSGSAGKIAIETISGDVDVEELTGEMDIGSTSGELAVKQLTGAAKISSSSGSVESDLISGSAQLGTTSGDITVQRIDGDVTAESSSGSVRILAGDGGRRVKTTSGDIRLEGTGGAWETHSSSGNVWIKAQEGSGRISTTSGDISLELQKLAGSLDIDSSSGWVKIGLPPDNSFDFEAATSSGDIETFFDDDLNFSKKGNSASGTYGNHSDGSSLSVKTTSGDIEVTK